MARDKHDNPELAASDCSFDSAADAWENGIRQLRDRLDRLIDEDYAELTPDLLALQTALEAVASTEGRRRETSASERRSLNARYKAELARAEALGEELKLARRLIRERDAQLQELRKNRSWTLNDLSQGISDILHRRRTVRAGTLDAARSVYRQIPLSETTRRRIRERALQGLRLYRSVRSRPQVKAGRAAARAERRPVSFPLPGCISALPELLGETPKPLDVTVSVVIPTYNAGADFRWLLHKLRAQKGLRGVEIVIVDSGSSDATVANARKAGCTLVEIDKGEFSHSYARNLGAEHATGELLLFTVQDAYPIGDFWLHALASTLLEPRSDEERLAAVSCAEFPRADSEFLYNALIDTHYRFLGCHEGDRIGQLTGSDNLSLRMQGQLSDVACLIQKTTFDRYLYHGRYAEDLILGIRLIRDGHRIGMLSSVKVIHSHNRPSSYYVRRIFVDVVFLTEVFADFETPLATSVIGTFAASGAIQEHLQPFCPNTGESADEALAALIEGIKGLKLPRFVPVLSPRADFGFAPLGEWLTSYSESAGRVGRTMTTEDVREAERLRNMVVDRLSNLHRYLAAVGPTLDEGSAAELTDAVQKTLAMSVGAQLAFIYVNAELAPAPSQDARISALKPLLLAGI